MRPDIYHTDFTLTAAEVDPQLELPMSRLFVMLIEAATAHANELGIGFEALRPHGASWVLSRVAIDIIEMPRVLGSYRLYTWVESLNRLFSERHFRLVKITDGEETTVAWVHSIWMAIDMTSRRPADLGILGDLSDVIKNRPFEGVKAGKIAPIREEDSGFDYQFRVSDIDVNSHVTTRRYIDLIIDLWPLEQYQKGRIARFEIAFKHEARYGETARVSRLGQTGQISVDGTPCALASITFTDR